MILGHWSKVMGGDESGPLSPSLAQRREIESMRFKLIALKVAESVS